MVDLLFRFGADPSSCDFAEVLETYNRPIMDLFVEAGVDPCADSAVARALWRPARPVLGSVKAHRGRFPCLQRQIDTELHVVVDGNKQRGVALMLWLGGDPYVMAPSEAYTEEAGDSSHCAMESALWSDRAAICKLLLRRPTPAGHVDRLLRAAQPLNVLIKFFRFSILAVMRIFTG